MKEKIFATPGKIALNVVTGQLAYGILLTFAFAFLLTFLSRMISGIVYSSGDFYSSMNTMSTIIIIISLIFAVIVDFLSARLGVTSTLKKYTCNLDEVNDVIHKVAIGDIILFIITILYYLFFSGLTIANVVVQLIAYVLIFLYQKSLIEKRI